MAVKGGARGSAAIGGFFVNYFLFFGFLRSFSERDLITATFVTHFMSRESRDVTLDQFEISKGSNKSDCNDIQCFLYGSFEHTR